MIDDQIVEGIKGAADAYNSDLLVKAAAHDLLWECEEVVALCSFLLSEFGGDPLNLTMDRCRGKLDNLRSVIASAKESASLIGASSDLLLACEAFVGAFGSGVFADPAQVIPYVRSMRDAINKAKGGNNE